MQYFKADAPLNRPQSITGGTFVTTDLQRTRRWLEEFAGLDCTIDKNGRLLVRDRGPNGQLHPRDGIFWTFEVSDVPEISHPQHVLNHWGFNLASLEEVDAANAAAIEMADQYGIGKVQKARDIHGAYAFYFQDLDYSWWEFRYQAAATIEKAFNPA